MPIFVEKIAHEKGTGAYNHYFTWFKICFITNYDFASCKVNNPSFNHPQFSHQRFLGLQDPNSLTYIGGRGAPALEPTNRV